MEANLYPNRAVLSKYAIAHQIGDYNGLFDVNPTLQAIFDIKEKGEAFFATGPGTFTRASVGSYWDFKGDMQEAAIDEPRFGYDPLTGELLGLLVEEARTNILLNSETIATQDVTVTAQAYTVSFYGTGSITFSGAHTGTLEGTGEKERVSVTFTPTAGTVTCTVTGTAMYGNFEAGTKATSWIPTTGTPSTRAPDYPLVSGTDFSDFFKHQEGFFYTEYKLVDTSLNRYIIFASDGTTDNFIAVRSLSGVTTNGVRKASGTTYNITKEYYSGVSKNVFTYDKNLKIYGAVNGVDMTSSPANTDGLSTGIDRLLIGHFPSGSFLNGYIKKVVYWPNSLTYSDVKKLSI